MLCARRLPSASNLQSRVDVRLFVSLLTRCGVVVGSWNCVSAFPNTTSGHLHAQTSKQEVIDSWEATVSMPSRLLLTEEVWSCKQPLSCLVSAQSRPAEITVLCLVHQIDTTSMSLLYTGRRKV